MLSLVAAFALVAPMAAHAAGDSDQKSVPVSGNVSSLCVLGSPDPGAVNVGQMAQTSGANTGRITSISTQNVALANSFCNYAGTHVQVDATALVANDTSAVQSGFSRAVNYNATVTTWASTAPSATTAAAADGSNPTTSNTGGTLCTPKLTNLTLALSNFAVPSNALLVAGGYTGTVVITLGPAVGGCQAG
jgi:hypothetical protein